MSKRVEAFSLRAARHATPGHAYDTDGPQRRRRRGSYCHGAAAKVLSFSESALRANAALLTQNTVAAAAAPVFAHAVGTRRHARAAGPPPENRHRGRGRVHADIDGGDTGARHPRNSRCAGSSRTRRSWTNRFWCIWCIGIASARSAVHFWHFGVFALWESR